MSGVGLSRLLLFSYQQVAQLVYRLSAPGDWRPQGNTIARGQWLVQRAFDPVDHRERNLIRGDLQYLY